mmetsp:Transcript_69379/g.112607  ORF Transcript_69379/g.112607 Transcript_69379/m.112607 type:complete len:213 (+) Transcript_69379:240-878(+)
MRGMARLSRRRNSSQPSRYGAVERPAAASAGGQKSRVCRQSCLPGPHRAVLRGLQESCNAKANVPHGRGTPSLLCVRRRLYCAGHERNLQDCSHLAAKGLRNVRVRRLFVSVQQRVRGIVELGSARRRNARWHLLPVAGNDDEQCLPLFHERQRHFQRRRTGGDGNELRAVLPRGNQLLRLFCRQRVFRRIAAAQRLRVAPAGKRVPEFCGD